MNAFITSQFSYCHFTKKDEANLSLDDLLKKNKSASTHQRNLQILATEIYKEKNDLGP